MANSVAVAPRALALAALASLFGCTTMDGTGINGNPPGDGGPQFQLCPTPVVHDAQRAKRADCGFSESDPATDTLGISQAARNGIPVDHVIVLMKENRSYDQLFGHLSDVDPEKYEGIPPGFSNKDADGNDIAPFHQTETAFPDDPNHQWDAMHAQVNGGKMDGFVTSAAATTGTDGHFVMGYYDEGDFPFYYFLAKTFALGDRHFPSALSGTWPNRDYLYAATSDGVRETSDLNPLCTPDEPGCIPHTPLIFDRLDQAPGLEGGTGIPWGVYADNLPLAFALEWGPSHPGVHPTSELFDGLASGNLPNVVFADAALNQADDHPPADIKAGERWTKRIYDAAVKSPLWKRTVIFFTYDEAGGFFDHVPPPPYDAEKSKVCVARDQDADFHELGIRVPLVVVSHWARRGYVSHARHEHTSITRFIELLFDLPALTKRDANSDAFLDMFDFSCEVTTPLPGPPDIGGD